MERSAMKKWVSKNIPPQNGRRAIVTGTGGIGFETALALARSGANVILAGRNPRKGNAATAAIQSLAPGSLVKFEQLDLANLGSIADFAARLSDDISSVDLLINNAGIMMPPARMETTDGFELQFGTNYLGHFALTARLLPLLMNGNASRVISVGSIAARSGRIDFPDLQAKRNYNPMRVYRQSKLACVMFALELSRRSKASKWGVKSVAAHPGVSRTDLLLNQQGSSSPAGIVRRYLSFLFQPAWQGALPLLYAATDPGASNGGYFGPDMFGGTRGYPAREIPPKEARDEMAAAKLWDISQDLTGVSFPRAIFQCDTHTT
jgi:NAD(P)-dependent dehydrogenase (short-subunit alcohol dehydrogenase family)